MCGMSGKVIYVGTTNKGGYVIRYPQPRDAASMCDYINALSQEKTFILFQGEEIELEFEEKYLQGQLEKIESGALVQLLVVADDSVIGVSEIGLKGRVENHVGDFGISVARDWRGLGIGAKLMQVVLEEAKAHLATLEIVTLSVFDNNQTALRMYQRFGFQEFGRLPRGIIHRGEYVDHVHMYKAV